MSDYSKDLLAGADPRMKATLGIQLSAKPV